MKLETKRDKIMDILGRERKTDRPRRSWLVGNIKDGIPDNADLKALPLTLDDIYIGCEIVDPYRNISVILGRIEDVIFLKYKGSIGLLTKTIEQLKHSLYTVVSPEHTKRDKIMDMLKRVNDTIAVPDDVREQIVDEILSLDEAQK